MRINKYYLYASLLPSITALLSGLIQMPQNCHQCFLLLIVGSGCVLLSLLVLNVSYFLLYVKSSNKSVKLIVNLFASLLPSIIYSTFLFTIYYDHSRQDNTDFRIFFPSALTCFIFGVWTAYKHMDTGTELIKN